MGTGADDVLTAASSVDLLTQQAIALALERGLICDAHSGSQGVVLDIQVLGERPTGGVGHIGLLVRPWTEGQWAELWPYARREVDALLALKVAEELYTLVPGSGDVRPPLLTLDGLADVLSTLRPLPRVYRSSVDSEPSAKKTAFCAMPFHPDFLDVFHLAIVPAAQRAGIDVLRVDQAFSFTGITQRIWDGIGTAALTIADISRTNPNVMYEVGLAHGLACAVLLICDHETDIPFDVRDNMVLRYQRLHLRRLRDDLATRLDSLATS
jgi:hypothetical protein